MFLNKYDIHLCFLFANSDKHYNCIYATMRTASAEIKTTRSKQAEAEKRYQRNKYVAEKIPKVPLTYLKHST